MRSTALFLLLAAASIAAAEPGKKIAGFKFEVPPKIDGIVNPSEWEKASKASGFVHVSTGDKAEFDAEVYAGYDKDNLYFAFSCPDPEPKQIRRTEYRRNVRPQGDDYVTLFFNPFGNHQESEFNQFEVGAGGGMKATFAGGRVAKREWEGAWDAKSRVTDHGWEAEIVIPWKILRLPGAGTRDFEANFVRVIPRKQLPLAWCELGAQEKMENNGWITGVDVPEIKQENTIQALPYQILGYDQELGKEVINTGLDVRYSISPQLSSMFTLNPDFRNVEGAVLNLAFSRFERLAEERRPFFVEGQQDFAMGGFAARLFAPQRLRSLDAGAKVFGKLSDTQSIAALFTAEANTGTAAVGRYRRTWGQKSYLNLGGVFWDDKEQNIKNFAGDFELVHWDGKWGADLIYNQTRDSDEGNGARRDFDLMYQDETYFLALGHQAITEKFLPRIGFAPRTGFEGWNFFSGAQYAFNTGPLTELQFQSFSTQSEAEDGSGVYLDSIFASVELTTRSNLGIELGYDKSNFRGDRAEIGSLEVKFNQNDPYRFVRLNGSLGRVDGADYSLFGASGNYRFTNRISISPALQFEKDGDETNLLHILGVSYEIDRDRSIAGRLVRRDDATNWYLAYRHSGNIGTEWYVILGDPNASEFQRKIIVKAVIPITLKI